jgi:cytochrome P450
MVKDEGVFQLLVLAATIGVFSFIVHVALSPHFLGGRLHAALMPAHVQSRSVPVPRLFDHPEPNFSVFFHIGEYFSTLTVIPVSGVMLLATAIRQKYPIILVALYLHITAMYMGAFVSHLTLVPIAFQCTVTGVVWNSLLAFWILGDVVPLLLADGGAPSSPVVTFLVRYPWVRRALAFAGAAVAALTVAHLPEYLCRWFPNGGFVALSIVQPPFVAAGLAAAWYMKRFASTTPPSSSPRGRAAAALRSCPGVELVFRGGVFLMLAMALSAVETFVDPLIVTAFGGYPLPVLHLIIHVLEQVGIYAYGVGSAAIHFFHVEGRREDVALVIGNRIFCGSDADCDHQVVVQGASGSASSAATNTNSNSNSARRSSSLSPSRHVALERVAPSWYVLPFVCTGLCSDQDSALRYGAKIIAEQAATERRGGDDDNVTVSVDLLMRAARCDPHTFALGPSRWVDLKSVQPCEKETRVKAVFDAELIEYILKRDGGGAGGAVFSSNPFGDDESRYVGLSTTSAAVHARHVTLLAPFFSDQYLRGLAPVLTEISQFMARATFGGEDDAPQEQRRAAGGDVVWYAYRVVIANALAVLGMDRGVFLDLALVDFVVRHSLAMVAAVAPVGGSGPRARLTLPMLGRVVSSLLRANPDTLRVVWRLGVAEAFRLFRPDTSVLGPLLGVDPAGGRGLRGGILSSPESFEAAPRYFLFLHSLWQRSVSHRGNIGGNKNSNNIFAALQRGVDAGTVRVAEGLAMVSQLLIGMTAANGLVSCVKRLLQTPQYPLLEFGRVLLPPSRRHPTAARAICAETLRCIRPLTDDEVRDVFDSPEALQHFINEVLRVDAPLQRMPRRVARAVRLPDGTELQQGDQLSLFVGAANLSERLGGPCLRPYTNEHDRAAALAQTLTFGRGMHRCIGRTLTQLDIECGLEGFFRHFALCRSAAAKHTSKKTSTNHDVVTAESVIRVRNSVTLDLGDLLYDVDVGNFGHKHAHVVELPIKKQ